MQEMVTLQEIIQSYGEFLKQRGPYVPTEEEMKKQENFDKPLHEMIENNPKLLLPWVGSILSGLGIVAATFVPSAGVSAMGFTAAGVTAGSFAAGWQAAIGVVGAGSTFAFLQSIGATGLLFPPALLVVGAGAGGVFGTRQWYIQKEQKEQKKWNEEHQEQLQELRKQLHILKEYFNYKWGGQVDMLSAEL